MWSFLVINLLLIVTINQLILAQGYKIAAYVGQVNWKEGSGNTLLEGIELCTTLLPQNRRLRPVEYNLYSGLPIFSNNNARSIDFRASNIWLSDLLRASECSIWNRDKINEILSTGYSVGWANCAFSSSRRNRSLIGIDLSLIGILSMLKKIIGLIFRFSVTDISPKFPEVRRSVCMSSGSGQMNLKYWIPRDSSRYYRLEIVSNSRILGIKASRFSSTSYITVICGCLEGNTHQTNGSRIELLLKDYHTCLLAAVSFGWSQEVLAYELNLGGVNPEPYRAIKGTEVYDPGMPAVLFGIGKLGDEVLGMLDCVQNQNNDLWSGYS